MYYSLCQQDIERPDYALKCENAFGKFVFSEIMFLALSETHHSMNVYIFLMHFRRFESILIVAPVYFFYRYFRQLGRKHDKSHNVRIAAQPKHATGTNCNLNTLPVCCYVM
jgi:hypothetical protein